jgi:hypothetical protein
MNSIKKDFEILQKANDHCSNHIFKQFMENYEEMKENSTSFDVILEFADNKKLKAHKTILEGI